MSSIPRDVLAQRSPALHQVLHRLPDRFLVALIEGVEQADVVVPGKLFAGRSGGCAVGIALRALHPKLPRGRLGQARRCRRSVTTLCRGLEMSVGRLHAFEEVFDRTVSFAAARTGHADALLAREVADWVAAEARQELLRREIDSEWLDAVEQRIEGRALAEVERELAGVDRELAELEPELERELAELLHEWALAA